MRFRNIIKRLGVSATYLMLIVSVVSIAACSSKPSESQVKADVEKSLNEGWPGMCKMIYFQKTNGEGDSRHYTIYYTYHAEILQDTTGYSSVGMGFHISALNGFRWLKRMAPGTLNNNRIIKGDVFQVDHSRSYRKTENGWIKSDF